MGLAGKLLSGNATPVYFVGSAFSDSGGVAGTSYSQDVPSGLAGDMLIFVYGSNSPGTYSASGWTQLVASTRSAVYYKVAATDSEAAFSATTTNGGSVAGGVVLRFRNTSTTPVAGTAAAAAISGGGTITATAVSATFGDYVLQAVVDGGGGRSFTQPSVSTGTLFTETDGEQPSVFVFYQIGGSSDATTTKTGASSTTNFVQVRLRA